MILLPFVPILKGGEDESTIREALRLLQANEQFSQLETVLGFFASFVLDNALVQQILRWDMAVLRESPWYQQIVTDSEERGERRGVISGIEMTLEMKFGSEGLQLMPQIPQISDLESLKAILRSTIAANTIAEIQQLM